MKLTCWIIDDEPLAQSLLEVYVVKTPFLSITGKFSSAVHALEELKSSEVNLIFLDIQMPDFNGLEFSKQVPTQTKIIFTTAFSEYAIDGYKVNAIDYLLKPFSYSEFLEAAQKALNWFKLIQKADENTENESFFVKSEYKNIQIFFSDILYIEGLKDYIKIYTQKNSKPIITLMNLKSIEEILPKKLFMRIHRSYIIAINKIKELNKSQVKIGDKIIPIGETYHNDFLHFIENKG